VHSLLAGEYEGRVSITLQNGIPEPSSQNWKGMSIEEDDKMRLTVFESIKNHPEAYDRVGVIQRSSGGKTVTEEKWILKRDTSSILWDKAAKLGGK
jgi:hypothetical protein